MHLSELEKAGGRIELRFLVPDFANQQRPLNIIKGPRVASTTLTRILAEVGKLSAKKALGQMLK